MFKYLNGINHLALQEMTRKKQEVSNDIQENQVMVGCLSLINN